MIRDFINSKIPSLFRLSIFAIAFGVNWESSAKVVTPMLERLFFPSWVIAAAPLIWNLAGALQSMLKRFSFHMLNFSLVGLDAFVVANILFFLIFDNLGVFLVLNLVLGFLSSLVGFQWSVKIKSHIAERYTAYANEYFNMSTSMVSWIGLGINVLNMGVMYLIGSYDTTLILSYCLILGILNLVYQFYFIGVIKNEDIV